MKTLILVLIVGIGMFSCKKLDAPRELPSETSIHLPGDVELVSHYMDSLSRVMKRGGNGGNPHNPPTNPPTIKRGCVLLDFNGHLVNSIWGYFYCTGSGNVDIQSIVNRVRFDFLQFDIDIITDESVYYTYPENKRVRIVITTTNFYGNVGGVAYINSWNWFGEKEAFVFSSLLHYSAKYISDAASHESGHTLGCRHHSDWGYNEDGSCFKRSEYLVSNHLMGNSYYNSFPIFTIGVSSIGCYVEENYPVTINYSINQ
jgi:hypothetical protein